MYLVIRYFLIEKYLKNQFIYLERKNKVKIIQFINGRKTPRAFIHEGLYYFYFVFIFIHRTGTKFPFTPNPTQHHYTLTSQLNHCQSSNLLYHQTNHLLPPTHLHYEYHRKLLFHLPCNKQFLSL